MRARSWLIQARDWLLTVFAMVILGPLVVATLLALSPFLILGCLTCAAASLATTIIRLEPSRAHLSVCLAVLLPLAGVAGMLWWTGLGLKGFLPWLVGLSTGIGATAGVVIGLGFRSPVFDDDET